MSNNDIDVQKVGALSEGTGVTHGSTRPRDAHAEYVKETQHLTADQIATLFATLQ
jgi:hypothetical protein